MYIDMYAYHIHFVLVGSLSWSLWSHVLDKGSWSSIVPIPSVGIHLRRDVNSLTRGRLLWVPAIPSLM